MSLLLKRSKVARKYDLKCTFLFYNILTLKLIKTSPNNINQKFSEQFQKDNQAFEARLEKLKRERRTVSRSSLRLFSKQKPKGVELKSRRQVKERLSDAQFFTNEKNKFKRVTN